jgi:hypothetical protein
MVLYGGSRLMRSLSMLLFAVCDQFDTKVITLNGFHCIIGFECKL